MERENKYTEDAPVAESVNKCLQDYGSASINRDSHAECDVSLPLADVYPASATTMTGRERASSRWITVELLVVMVSAGFGGLAVLKGQYIRHRISLDMFGNMSLNGSQESPCDMGSATAIVENEIQKLTSNWNLYLSMASSFPSLFATLLLGTLSEHYGRRIAIFTPCFGFLVQNIVCLFVVSYHLPLSVLFVGEVAAGFSGSLALFMAASFSYVTDISTEKSRMIRIVIVEILIFAGIGIMQVVLGYLIRDSGFARSLWLPFTVLFLACVNAGTPCLLIETVDNKLKARRSNPVKIVLRDIINLLSISKDKRNVILSTYLVIGLLVGIVTQGAMQVSVLYGQGQPFCWLSVIIGFFITWSLLLPGIGTLFSPWPELFNFISRQAILV